MLIEEVSAERASLEEEKAAIQSNLQVAEEKKNGEIMILEQKISLEEELLTNFKESRISIEQELTQRL